MGRPLRGGREQGERAQAHHRGGQASRGRRPEQQPQVAGTHRVRRHHARARRDPRRRVRTLGQQGLELRCGARGRGVAARLPQGPHHRALQRGRPGRARVPRVPVLGVRVPGAGRSRRQRERGADPAHQAGTRRLGTRRRGAWSPASRRSRCRDAPRRCRRPPAGLGGRVSPADAGARASARRGRERADPARRRHALDRPATRCRALRRAPAALRPFRRWARAVPALRRAARDAAGPAAASMRATCQRRAGSGTADWRRRDYVAAADSGRPRGCRRGGR